MLNIGLRVTPINATHARVSWETSWPDGASWLFVNGRKVVGPHITGTALRTMPILLAADAVADIEVHDFEDTDQLIQPIGIPPNTRPLLIWRDVADAARFRVYHKERDDLAETRVYDQPRRPGQARHRILCPIVLSGLGGRWHLLRVEAVDAYGNESSRESWAYFVTEPAQPAGLSVTEGSGAGLYTIAFPLDTPSGGGPPIFLRG